MNGANTVFLLEGDGIFRRKGMRGFCEAPEDDQ